MAFAFTYVPPLPLGRTKTQGDHALRDAHAQLTAALDVGFPNPATQWQVVKGAQKAREGLVGECTNMASIKQLFMLL